MDSDCYDFKHSNIKLGTHLKINSRQCYKTFVNYFEIYPSINHDNIGKPFTLTFFFLSDPFRPVSLANSTANVHLNTDTVGNCIHRIWRLFTELQLSQFGRTLFAFCYLVGVRPMEGKVDDDIGHWIRARFFST